MKYNLARKSIVINSFTFDKIKDEDIQAVLNDSLEGEEMISLLKLLRPNHNLGFSYQEKIDYYLDVIERAFILAKHKYAEDYKNLFLAFAMRDYAQDDKEAYDLVKSQADNFADAVDGMTDEMWFMHQSLNYEILNIYNVDMMLKNPDMLEYTKKLINKLKPGQERYKNLSEKF